MSGEKEMIDAGKKFDDAVRATGVIGGIRSDIQNMQNDMTEVKLDVKAVATDVKAIKSTVDRWGGALVLVGSLVSVAVSLVVGLLK